MSENRMGTDGCCLKVTLARAGSACITKTRRHSVQLFTARMTTCMSTSGCYEQWTCKNQCRNVCRAVWAMPEESKMRKPKQVLNYEDRLAGRERKAALQKWNAEAAQPLSEAALPAVQTRDRIVAGLQREDALRIYTAAVNKEDTLFSFNETLPAKLDQMRALLHDSITADEAYALNDVLYRRRRFIDMIAWQQDEPIAWDGYFAR